MGLKLALNCKDMAKPILGGAQPEAVILESPKLCNIISKCERKTRFSEYIFSPVDVYVILV